MSDFDTDRREAATKAERLGLFYYIFQGRMYVIDGGARGFRDDNWTAAVCWGTSSRPATEEEQQMWEMLQ